MRDGRTYGFAIIGCGVIASVHYRSIATIPNALLHVVMDADPARAAHFAADYGDDGCTTLEAVLDRSDVDVVCVCIPSGLHAEIGIQAASAGKHLVVEKPIEITLDDRRPADRGPPPPRRQAHRHLPAPIRCRRRALSGLR